MLRLKSDIFTWKNSDELSDFNIDYILRNHDKEPIIMNKMITLTDWLGEKPQNSPQESMDLLKAASVSYTQWSCVFHLDDFTVDYAIDHDFDHIYTFRPEDY